WVANRKILREAYHSVIYCCVTMRVVLTDYVPHHTGAFLKAGFRVKAQLQHRPKQTAMYWLQTIAYIRKATAGDGGKRVSQIAFTERIRKLYAANFAALPTGSDVILLFRH